MIVPYSVHIICHVAVYLGLLRVECFGSLHSLLYTCIVGVLKIAKENRLASY